MSYFSKFFKVLFILILLIIPACKTIISHQDIKVKVKQEEELRKCQLHDTSTKIFAIYTNNKDIGREVRTSYQHTGPMGEETITVSHAVTRHLSNTVEIDRYTIFSAHFLNENNKLLRASNVTKEESAVILSLVGFNGIGWDRIHEAKTNVLEPIKSSPLSISLTGEELVGFKLNEHLKKIALGKALHNIEKNYYHPSLSSSSPLEFSEPKSDQVEWSGKIQEGTWIEATRKNSDRIVLRMFINTKNQILIEEYPSINQKRILIKKDFTLPTDYLSPYRGLFSNAYLGYPDKVTKAIYEIISKQPLSLTDFEFIDEPENQTLEQIDEKTLKLVVKGGSTSGFYKPKNSDLEPSKYIQPDHKIIVNGLEFLKSGGKKGKLPKYRVDNALPVVARYNRFENKTSFWENYEAVAYLIAEYVNTLLPDKRLTHSMQDAVTALEAGLGDCTEHSVLFASFMRAAKIPTRLVSGMYLSYGGSWIFHMWNEFWDGTKWRGIDTAIGPTLDPAAHYVALSKGVSNFKDHKNNIAFFLDRSFTGMDFNLIHASANGDTLRLALPKRYGFVGNDALLFHAITKSERGDYQAAYELIEKNIDPDTSPISLKLLQAELSYKTRRYNKAYKEVKKLRKITSLPINVLLLDQLELKLCARKNELSRCEEILVNLKKTLKYDEPHFLINKAEYLHLSGETKQALNLLENALLNYENDIYILKKYIQLASYDLTIDKKKLSKRIDSLLFNTYHSESDALKAIAEIKIKSEKNDTALSFLLHALLLKPEDIQLNELKKNYALSCE